MVAWRYGEAQIVEQRLGRNDLTPFGQRPIHFAGVAEGHDARRNLPGPASERSADVQMQRMRARLDALRSNSGGGGEDAWRDGDAMERDTEVDSDDEGEFHFGP